MKIIGKTTIHPFFFYTGKIAGYAAWVLLLLEYCGFDDGNLRLIVYHFIIKAEEPFLL